MSRSSLRIPAVLRSAISLALAGQMVVGAVAAETPKGGAAAATGALSVTTDPVNAEVFVDGRPAGQTPTNLVSLSAGEHRVRIVKSGYLENARIVTVAAGAPTVLNVKLTKTSASTVSEAGQVTSTGGGGGGGIPKWVWFAAAGGAAVAVVALLPRNKPPVAGTITVSPTGTGMAGQTSFTIRSTGASDPDGDALTRTWRFSDNTTATGESVSKTFTTQGTFQVNLDVSDGKETVTAPAASITVGPNLTASWTGGSVLMPSGSSGALIVTCGIGFALTQNGTSLSGTMPFAGNCTGSAGTLSSGSVSVLAHPSGITTATSTFQFTSGGFVFSNLVFSFSGTTNTAGTSMTGNLTLSQTSSNFSSTSSVTLNRQ